MNILSIEHYPNKSFGVRFYPRIFSFTIDLNQSVRNKLKAGEVLTNELAVKIFNQIKWKSDVLSFLTKPVVFIPSAVAVTVAGFAIPMTGVALTVTSLALCSLGGFMGGLSYMELCSNKILSELSQAYSEQSTRAAEYIKKLENSNIDLKIVLA
jgi:hypothetical protein